MLKYGLPLCVYSTTVSPFNAGNSFLFILDFSFQLKLELTSALYYESNDYDYICTNDVIPLYSDLYEWPL